MLHQRSAQLSPNSRKPNRRTVCTRRIDLGRNGLNRHPDSGKIVRRSRISRRLRLQTASRTVRQNVRWCRTNRKHDNNAKRTGRRSIRRKVQTAENQKNYAQNSGARRAEVSASDEKAAMAGALGFSLLIALLLSMFLIIASDEDSGGSGSGLVYQREFLSGSARASTDG